MSYHRRQADPNSPKAKSIRHALYWMMLFEIVVLASIVLTTPWGANP